MTTLTGLVAQDCSPTEQIALDQTISAGADLIDSLQSGWPSPLVLNRKNDSALYKAYPWFFLPAFPTVCDADAIKLCAALRLVSDAVVLSDSIFDDPPLNDLTAVALTIQAAQFEAYRLLNSLFPADHAFWERFRQYFSHFAEVCLLERQYAVEAGGWERSTEHDLLIIAAGKACMAKSVIVGLAGLHGVASVSDELTRSIEHFHLGIQLLDDLKDWKSDLRRGVPTYVLRRFITERPALEPNGRVSGVERFARELYYGGHAQHTLQLAMQKLARARELALLFPLTRWCERIEHFQRRCELMSIDIERIINSNITSPTRKVELPSRFLPSSNLTVRLANDSLEFILGEWQRGFGEARHVAPYPIAFDPLHVREAQFGDVFQRAYITSALADANALLHGDLEPIVASEAQYLLDTRLTHGFGGWSYFPSMDELPPDAENLAQVLMALLGSDIPRSVVAEHIEVPLSIMLRDCLHPDGSLDRWIIPTNDRTAIQELQRKSCDEFWGTQLEPSVAASVAIALANYDPARYSQVVQTMAAWIERMQDPCGSWTSPWLYECSFFTTLRCARALAVVVPGSERLARTYTYIRQSQRPDGSWAPSEQSAGHALSTAHALSCLALSKGTVFAEVEDRVRTERAFNFLALNRYDRNSWPRLRFYQSSAQRYGSRTLTTTSVLLSCLAWIVPT